MMDLKFICVTTMQFFYLQQKAAINTIDWISDNSRINVFINQERFIIQVPRPNKYAHLKVLKFNIHHGHFWLLVSAYQPYLWRRSKQLSSQGFLGDHVKILTRLRLARGSRSTRDT